MADETRTGEQIQADTEASYRAQGLQEMLDKRRQAVEASGGLINASGQIAPASQVDRMKAEARDVEAAAINSPTPLQSSVDLADKNSLLEPARTVENPLGTNLFAPVTNQATVDKNRPLSPQEYVATNNVQPFQGVGNGDILQPSTMQPVAAPVATPEATQAAATATVNGIMNPYAGAIGMQQAGINSAAKAGHEAAVAEHEFAVRGEELANDEANKQLALKADFNVDYQEKMDGLEQSMKDMKALAGEKVIPGAFLARQDTAGSLMTGIAVALGGIGGALQGTNQNIGLEMINKAIDRDVAAQQFNLDFKYKVGSSNVANQTNLLSRMREKFGDDKSALAATKISMIDAAQRKMDAEKTKEGGSRDIGIIAQQQMASGVLAERRATLELQLRAAQEAAFKEKQLALGLSGDRSKWTDYQISYYEKSTGDKTLRERFVPGYGPATNKYAAEEFQKFNSEASSALDGIARVQDLSEKYNKVTDLADRRRIEVERQALIGKLRVPFTGPGILNDAERAALSAVIGDPNSIFSWKKLEQASLSQVETIMRDAQKRRIKEAGFDKRPEVSAKIGPAQ